MVRKIAGNYFVFSEKEREKNPVPVVMNETGYFIYEAKNKGLGTEDIISAYAKEFSISEEIARADVEQIIGEV